MKIKNIGKFFKSPFIKGDVRRTGGLKAFTLFELLVSISIIGILTAIASVSYGAAQKKARDSRRIEDLNGIQKAAEMYYSQKNYVYPSTTGSSGDFVTSGVLQQWPTDPKGVGGTPYFYTSTGSSYCACAALDSNSGNSSSPFCNFASSGLFYCVKNQQ